MSAPTKLLDASVRGVPDSQAWRPLQAALRKSFDTEFTLLDDTLAIVARPAGAPPLSDDVGELVRVVARQSDPQLVAEDPCVAIVAIPARVDGLHLVAVAPFAIANAGEPGALDSAARLLGLNRDETAQWLQQQRIWPAHALLRIAEALAAQLAAEARACRLEREMDTISDNLSSTYEEISLLYGVTQNLRLSSSDEELGTLALDWLKECLPAEGLAIQFHPVADGHDVTYKARTDKTLLVAGQCPLDNDQFSRLVQWLELSDEGPFVANDTVTATAQWPFDGIRQLIVVPLVESDNVFGHLAAFNHREGAEFGTVEASLLSSIGAMLGIHSGNCELYRQQAEFLASVVRALTSAIDAKDPYTCGHSDRVARISVCLAKRLGYDSSQLNTIYMSGLLHDIGKIGIDDNVLRKPGRLTDAEFEHIKLHPELGHKILADLRQLKDVLPAVLHHHEQWDGRGYPSKLEGENIPLSARIVAVADAYDAMTSDRPYRHGMPEQRVDEIFRGGAGQQWDQRVINAYFEARNEIRETARRERANLSLDVQQWT